jgi:structural maintenance of chromosome 3 (chondroitin sulfate proteoglycan 6)
MSAYVEIIFDNSDDRFPTGKEELILRRTIGLKKDEYSLDRKNATKADVMNLLESAGFSRSNPYYIVPQGRVTALTNMKDSERLSLLKEVAGTQVYEARRTESLKIMHETNNKLQKIDELLDFINARLAELEQEKEELRSYQEKDKEKRCLEYTIFSREQAEITSALEQIEEQRQTGLDGADESSELFLQGEKDMTQMNTEISRLKQQVDFLMVDKRQLEDERKDNAKARAQTELQIKNLTDGQSAAQQAKARHDTEMKRLRAAIAERERELNELLPEYNAHRQQELEVKNRLDEAETARQRLYTKQGRNARFRNKKERDDWLREQINDAFTSLSKVKAVKMQTSEETAQLQKDIATAEPGIEKLQNQLSGRGDAVLELDQQVQVVKEERDRLMDRRKEIWREMAKTDTVVANVKDELSKAERQLSHMMDSNTSRGLAAVRRIKRQYQLPGVFGTLAELIEVPERYRTAVEVIAGSSLFHCVVDNDETATKVLDILNKEKSGRVTFMPLNRLKPKIPAYPQAQDAIPLISKVQFEKEYEKAVQQVLASSIICPNLTVASQYARSHHLKAVTPFGDTVEKRGALTGGFHDPRSSRLEASRNVLRLREELEMSRARDGDIEREVRQLDQKITKAVGELQQLEQQKQQLRSNHEPLREELNSKLASLRNKRQILEQKQQAMAAIESNVRALSDQQNAHEAELATDFKKTLTEAEENQLEQLTTTAQTLREEYVSRSASRSEFEVRKAVLEVELNDNLRPSLDQLQSAAMDSTDEYSDKGTLKEYQRDLKRLSDVGRTLSQRLSENESSMETSASEIRKLENRIAETRKQQEDLSKAIERQQRRMEKSTQKKMALQTQLHVTNDAIRGLGLLAEDAFKSYKNLDSRTVMKRLHKTNESLKQFSHVNKKAFEQHNSFTKQGAELRDRRKELEDSHKSIEDLVEVLDQRKDTVRRLTLAFSPLPIPPPPIARPLAIPLFPSTAFLQHAPTPADIYAQAIERTFRGVSKAFASVFASLVPAGRGRLIIQRKTDRSAANAAAAAAAGDEDSEDEQARKSVENYTGVGISVSFNSKHDEQQRIQQLSGGQKSEFLWMVFPFPLFF